jgi:hypothetical protein
MASRCQISVEYNLMAPHLTIQNKIGEVQESRHFSEKLHFFHISELAPTLIQRVDIEGKMPSNFFQLAFLNAY